MNDAIRRASPAPTPPAAAPQSALPAPVAWLLGCAPVLAATDSPERTLLLVLVLALAIAGTTTAVAALRRLLPLAAHPTSCVVILGGVVSAIGLLMRAFLFEQHLVLGLFLPLLTTHAALLLRAEVLAGALPQAASVTLGPGTALLAGTGLLLLGGLRMPLPAHPAVAFFGLALLVGVGAVLDGRRRR